MQPHPNKLTPAVFLSLRCLGLLRSGRYFVPFGLFARFRRLMGFAEITRPTRFLRFLRLRLPNLRLAGFARVSLIA